MTPLRGAFLAALMLLPAGAKAEVIRRSPDSVSSSSAAATYVNKAGDTMTGRLTAPDATLTYGLTAATASFSGSVTASSVTSQGKFTSKHTDAGASSPHYTFNGDENTGLYHIATDRVGLAAGGASVFDGDVNGVMNMKAPTGVNIELNLYGGLAYGVGGSQGLYLNDGTVRTGSFSSATGAVLFDSYRGGMRFRTSGSGSPLDAINIDTSQNVTMFASTTVQGLWANTGVFSGSVGIGTASPCSTCTLHVAGGASVTGALEVGSNTTITKPSGGAAILQVTGGSGVLNDIRVSGSVTAQLGTLASNIPYVGTSNNAQMDVVTNNATSFTFPAAGATTGGALCLNASKVLSKCTSAVDASGNCTCP